MPFQKGHKIRLGKKHLDKTKEKIRQKALGRKHSEATKKKCRLINLGRKHSEKTKEKMRKPKSEEHKRKLRENRADMSGKKHPNWKGGITPENMKIRANIEYRLWRESVFARDNWTCQKCKVKGTYLHSHHIKNFVQYPELRFAIDNGITLCENCHIKFHKIYGRKNNTKEQLKKFLLKL